MMLIRLLLLLIFVSPAVAQSPPCYNALGSINPCRALQNGDIPQAQDWNGFFQAKLDNKTQAIQVSTNFVIPGPGLYVLTNTGLTITLPTQPPPSGGDIVIVDASGAVNPSDIIVGNVNGQSGTTITAPGQSWTLGPNLSQNTWTIK
jgi:hypothetical protein